MDWFSGVVLYLIIWWTALFAVLPWGLERDERGIPKDHKLKKKFVINTLLSAVIWCIIAALIFMEVINFRELGTQMMEDSF